MTPRSKGSPAGPLTSLPNDAVPEGLADFVRELGASSEGLAIQATLRVAAAVGFKMEGLVPGLGEDSGSTWSEHEPGPSEPMLLRGVTADDRPVAIAVIATHLPRDDRGDAPDVDRLVNALETALGRWRFVVHLKRRLPAGFDPEPVARAVHMWRLALDRGEWKGRHAVYEDESVAVDLSVTRTVGSEQIGGAIAVVAPTVASDRLLKMYRRLVEAAHALDESGLDHLWYTAFVADPHHHLPRSPVVDLLYGQADAVETVGPTEPSFRGTFQSSGTSVFSDPLCKRLGAVWWLDLADGSIAGAAHQNPWCSERELPSFPGPRMELLERQAGSRVVVRWTHSR